VKRAFSLIEIIFVLIVLGILAGIGSEVIFNAYNNYILSKSTDQAVYRLEVATQQIAKRLGYRIPYSETVIKKDNSIEPLTDTPSAMDKGLQWIGLAYEARRGEWNGTFNTPGWSGFIDIDSPQTSKTSAKTAGSNLDIASDIIYALSEGEVDLNTTGNGATLFYLTPPLLGVINAYYTTSGIAHNNMVYKASKTIFTFDDSTTPKDIYEFYYLAWSAYAIVAEENSSSGDYSLYLYYNYRPWQGDSFLQGKKVLFIDHISTFTFRRRDRAIEIKICANSGDENNITFCSAKVVF